MGLIEVRRPDRRFNNETHFLWHSRFWRDLDVGQPPPAVPVRREGSPASTRHSSPASSADCSNAATPTDQQRALYKGITPSLSSNEVPESSIKLAPHFPADDFMKNSLSHFKAVLESSSSEEAETFIEAMLQKHNAAIPHDVIDTHRRITLALDAYVTFLLRFPPQERWAPLDRLRTLPLPP